MALTVFYYQVVAENIDGVQESDIIWHQDWLPIVRCFQPS
jgi:hypothetical protein